MNPSVKILMLSTLLVWSASALSSSTGAPRVAKRPSPATKKKEGASVEAKRPRTTTIKKKEEGGASSVEEAATTSDGDEQGDVLLPPSLANALRSRGFAAMLPVQRRAYTHVFEGRDLVVQSPTATGKTLAFVLPILARLLAAAPRQPATEWRDSLKSGKTRAQGGRVPKPRVLVIAPSRELCEQIGTEFKTMIGDEEINVATVFGGAPLERSVASLRAKGGADIVVATAGRLAMLMRRTADSNPALSLESMETLVLDEADALLNEDDTPEIGRLMNAMEQDYQMVLFSATITAKVRKFARGAMEVEHRESFVDNEDSKRESRLAHSSLAAVKSEWQSVASDLLGTTDSELSLVFVRSIVEARELAESLVSDLDSRFFDIRILHGDLDQQQRRKAVNKPRPVGKQCVLVATDVASRGLDLPRVGLVVQLGLPRKAGKEGTVDAELYAHRSGRAAREQQEAASSVLIFDPEDGERALLKKLADGMPPLLRPITPPSASEVFAASLNRALLACNRADPALTAAIAKRLDVDVKLAGALAALTGLQALPTMRSILTSRANDRTLRIDVDEDITPSDVVKTLKKLGSGKLDRVHVAGNQRSALLDIPLTKLEAFETAASAPGALPKGWKLSYPNAE